MDKVITLEGRISTTNAPEIEKKLQKEIPKEVTDLTIDASKLEYISSAGLRILLRLSKEHEQVHVINCSPEVYEIFSLTGFAEILDVSRPYKSISVEGLKKIGSGFYGDVYRLDDETIVKVYKYPDSLPMIRREKKLAKKAFVMGIPTAIPYDIVKVGDLYGTVFELLSAKPVAERLGDEKAVQDFCEKSVALLNKIHSTEVKEGELPHRSDMIMEQILAVRELLPEDVFMKLKLMAALIPETHTLLHSDFHIKNIMEQGDELLLIDMDTLSTGHPILELGAMYATYVAFSSVDKNNPMDFLGISYETSRLIWKLTFDKYFGEEKPYDVEKKIAIIAYLEVLFLRSKFGDKNNEITKKEIQYSIDFISKAVFEVDLLFY